MLKRKMYYIKACEINIIPFLDILLVLLLIFMISAPFVTQNFEVNLPSSSDLKLINKNNNMLRITIEILGNDRYNILMNHKKIKNISSDEILSKIYLKDDKKLTNVIFFIAAPYDISYNEVIKTLNFLYKIEAKNVNILTKPV